MERPDPVNDPLGRAALGTALLAAAMLCAAGLVLVVLAIEVRDPRLAGVH